METNDSLEFSGGEGNVLGISDDSTASGEAPDFQPFPDGIGDQGSTDSGSDLKSLNAKVKELENSLRNEENNYTRLLADIQNERNRTSKEVQLKVEQATKQILLDVLKVLDSFNRCLNSTYQDVADFRTGVGLIQKQFYDTLRSLKVSEIEIQVGDAFDAHVAEALTTIDTTAHPDGSVVDVYEKGFKIGDQLLRPAKVVVARGSDSPENLV